MTWASQDVQKFGIIGTSCSGKTTLTLKILAFLKEMGVSCDGVLQQDRRFSFDREQLPKYKEAQYYFICNQILRESELVLRGHAEVIVSDRSPLDLYAYYEFSYGRSEALLSMVKEWCTATYSQLYYVEPLPYEDDKQRPSDKFRMEVDDVLRNLPCCDFLIMPREQILNDILAALGKTLTTLDLNVIPHILDIPSVLIGGSYAFNRATKYSDLDVYIISTESGVIAEASYAKKLESMLGIKVEVHFVSNAVVWNYLISQGFKLIKRK